jgi:DNA repair and recombination protein RAD52
LQCRLDRQLGPEFISTRPGNGGGKVHYLAAEKVINLANEVFGFNGWSSAIQNVQIDFVDENTTTGRVNLGLSTIVRVTLRDGTYHEDIGYGHCENTKGKAAAFEKAKKEAATDAMKRALRNFGNVLGNCLYDKDYLQKITKVKVAPSRWDASNLHRHPDYAPVKPEAIVDGRSAQARAVAAHRNVSVQSNNSLPSEIEDEFGENVFDDGTEYTHPDEVRLDEAPTVEPTVATRAVPHVRPAEIPRQNAVPQMAAQTRPSNATRPSLGTLQSGGRGQPPQTPGQPGRQQMAGHAVAQMDVDGTRSNQSSGNAIDSPSHHAAAARKGVDGSASFHVTNIALSEVQEQPVPRGNLGGFVAAKQADLLNNPSAVRAPIESIAFNPHAESPSIRRTQGINPGKSVPISRHQIQNGAGSAPAMPPNPSAGLVGGASAMQGNSTKSPGAYHVNLVPDTSRRVGMPPPGGGGGGIQSRGGYRPPTALKRPAMTDVTNLPQTDGHADSKKAKTDGVDPGLGNEQTSMPVAHEVPP